MMMACPTNPSHRGPNRHCLMMNYWTRSCQISHLKIHSYRTCQRTSLTIPIHRENPSHRGPNRHCLMMNYWTRSCQISHLNYWTRSCQISHLTKTKTDVPNPVYLTIHANRRSTMTMTMKNSCFLIYRSYHLMRTTMKIHQTVYLTIRAKRQRRM